MAEVQVSLSFSSQQSHTITILARSKDLSKSKTQSSWTARSSLPAKPLKASDTTEMWVSDSKPLRKPLKVLMLTRSALSPATFPSEVESWSNSQYLPSIGAYCNTYLDNFRGVVVSTKMNRTIIIRRDYLHYISKYNRYEKRHQNVPAHVSPAFSVKVGDMAVIGQCR